MDISDVIDIGQDALLTAALLAGPILGVILLLGLLIGILQAATSIQEMTLSFVPKLLGLILLLYFIGNWQLGVLINYFERLMDALPMYLT
jgi:flagellar biosynthetic protein FliQ|tara:strand:+ start:384 stop:653 length:270 start_codon:yes stop_codon:yes gene_type:complete